jgi:integrase/recombinase XerD
MNAADIRQHVQTYAELREALGFPLGRSVKVIQEFVDYAITHDGLEPLTTRTVFDWLDRAGEQSKLRPSVKLGIVRQFLSHLSSAVASTEVPETRLLAAYERPKPFIFTPGEIEALLKAATESPDPDPFHRVTVHTILGLLVCTGLRVSEALNLDRADVMPRENPTALYIRETKFHKSRIVPVHPTTARQLSIYAGHRELMGCSQWTPAFFATRHSYRFTYSAISGAFRKLLDGLGLKARNGGNRPTLHSIRHTFVVTRILKWHEEHVDVHARLAHVSTYLGHADFRDTYWYLSATPELLATASAEFRSPLAQEVRYE